MAELRKETSFWAGGVGRTDGEAKIYFEAASQLVGEVEKEDFNSANFVWNVCLDFVKPLVRIATKITRHDWMEVWSILVICCCIVLNIRHD